MIHARYSENGYPANWVVVDILRLEEGAMVEHWNVIRDEAKSSASATRCSVNDFRPTNAAVHCDSNDPSVR
jgi:predicted SnoaL-like aldol condensation-catalyzing enzyme